ncbi:MAG: ABC transporter ATP-binding protein [candidate division Zixibacteria bacterium]|nr:ABC transporter ATP-binding protein [candidate division Zixibacteria bacterium]
MRRLLTYLKPYKARVFWSTVLLFIVTALQLTGPVLMQIAIDDYISVGDNDGLTRIALLYLGVLIAAFILGYIQFYSMQVIGQSVMCDIRMQTFKHLQKMHLGFFDKNPVGRLVTRVTNDVNVLNELFSSGVVAVIGDLLTLVGIIIAMLYYSWELTLISFAVLPFMVVATIVFRNIVRKIYREVRAKIARINAFLQEHLTGMSVVQLFNQEKRAFFKFDNINRSLRSQHFKSIYCYATFFPLVELIEVTAVVLLIYFGGVRISTDLLTFGELIAFIHLVERFFRPLRDLAEKYNILQSSMASSERIFKMIDEEPAISPPISPKTIADFKGKIEFDNVTFAYNEPDTILSDVNFTVNPGEKVAIVGSTGAGKTSLISLLLRFYDSQKGSIKIDGVPLKEMDPNYVRSHMALVLQDVFIFSGNFSRNIDLHDNKITEQKIAEAARQVGIADYIERQPDKYETEVQERGATLSTGQKQLLSFARALAYDPKILILDEATSSVDTETENIIQKALERLMRGRTSIIIAHRLSTIEKADRILVMHKGQLRESGTHRELLEQKGIYHTLYQTQFAFANGTK